MKKQMWDKIKNIIKSNQAWSIFVLIQILFMFFLVSKIWGEPTTLHYDADDFQIEQNTGTQMMEDGTVGVLLESQEQSEKMDILTLPIEGLRSGAYEIIVNYESSRDISNPQYNVKDIGGDIRFEAESNDKAFKASNISLDDGHQIAKGRIWLRIAAHAEGLLAKVQYEGYGKLTVKSIDFVEQPVWRVTRLLGYAILFLLLDLLYIFLFSENIVNLNQTKKYVIASLSGIVIASSILLCVDFAYLGHDAPFHYQRIWGLADALSNGQFPVRMHTGILGDAGYAQPLFYGELFLYIPALLYNMMVPLQTCYAIYAVLMNIATCLISFYCFKKISGKISIGIISSFLYTLSAYRLNNEFLRVAVGEYSAMTFLPLLILGFWTVYTAHDNEKLKLTDYIPIVLGITGIIQTHIISCEMMAIFIIAFCTLTVRKTLKKNRFCTLCKAFILTVLLNIWFLLPFLESLKMNVLVAQTDIVNVIQKNGTYLSQIFAVFQVGTGGNRLNSMEGEMPLTLGFSFVIIICVFLFGCIFRKELNLKKTKEYKVGCIGFMGVIAAIVLTNAYFPWDTAKYFHPLLGYYLCDIQFPWRYLSIATIFATLLTAMTLKYVSLKSEKYFKILTTLLIGIHVIVIGYFYTDLTFMLPEQSVHSISDIGTLNYMGGEYLFMDVDMDKALSRQVRSSHEEIEIKSWETQKGATLVSCKNDSLEPGKITLPVFAYDHYHAVEEQGMEFHISSNENSLIEVEIPSQYEGTIKVHYKEPVRWRVCEFISLLTLIGIAGTYVVERKQKAVVL